MIQRKKKKNHFKGISIKNHKYYSLNDITNIKNFDPCNIKINEKKNFHICYIGYVKIRDSKDVKINSVNPLYLIFYKVDGYLEEINGNI